MTTTVVVDASALVKRILGEPDSQRYRAWFNENESARFAAPVLIFYETGRVLEKSLPTMKTAELRVIHARLPTGIALLPPEESAWDARSALTFYDAQYLGLAHRLGATLLTADERTRAAASIRGVTALKI